MKMNMETVRTEVDGEEDTYIEYRLMGNPNFNTFIAEVALLKKRLFGLVEQEQERIKRTVVDEDSLGDTFANAREELLVSCGIRDGAENDDTSESDELELLKQAVSVAEGRDIE
jgi:hypothetical protein